MFGNTFTWKLQSPERTASSSSRRWAIFSRLLSFFEDFVNASTFSFSFFLHGKLKVRRSRFITMFFFPQIIFDWNYSIWNRWSIIVNQSRWSCTTIYSSWNRCRHKSNEFHWLVRRSNQTTKIVSFFCSFSLSTNSVSAIIGNNDGCECNKWQWSFW